MLENNFQKILIKFGLWLGIGFATMIIGVSNIFAEQVNVGTITNKTQVLLNIYNYGSPITLNAGSVNNSGQIEEIYIVIDNQSISANYTYMLELYTPNAKLSNVNSALVTSGGQSCQVIGLYGMNGEYPKVYFKCLNDINSSSSFTVTLYNNLGGTSGITSANNFSWSYTYLRYWTDDNDIDLAPVIANQNQNTQNIINNQNSNTQNIINNQNQNTQQQIESQKVCQEFIIDKTYGIENGYLNSSGVLSSSNEAWTTTDYIEISSDSTIRGVEGATSDRLCFYNSNKTNISCLYQVTSGQITIPDGSKYIRMTIRKSTNLPQLEIKTCKNGNQALDDSINDLNDSLNNDDSSGATSEASEFFNSFSTNTFGLTSIITAPLNLIQSVLSSTCTSLQLPLPYLNNKYLELPCMSSIYSEFFGSFFTIYQTITYGIIAYWVCVRIFNQVKDFKNPEHDEIEVMDL